MMSVFNDAQQNMICGRGGSGDLWFVCIATEKDGCHGFEIIFGMFFRSGFFHFRFGVPGWLLVGGGGVGGDNVAMVVMMMLRWGWWW